MSKNHPRWGSLLYHADYDFISFGVLFSNFLIVEAFYHSTQAIEKYLKVLALTIYDPDEKRTEDEWKKFLKGFGHYLERLGKYCSNQYPFYKQKDLTNNLKRFSEFDQATRYPWVERNLGNGFSGSDAGIVFELVKQLRNDIPIQTDDYPLGILLRGYHHHDIQRKFLKGLITLNTRKAALKLTEIFPNVYDLIRK